MTIQEMFTKPITRDVKGVIKVGQGEDANVKQELEEYVVTRELQKHIARFFDAYKKGITGNTDHMGVWISGFFGSGKSHFLKILSYLLENRVVDGKHAIDYFAEDHKIENGMVLADMKLAAETSADVILFNIDSKSEMSGKQDKEAILSVFLKVFNEMQGFYGANPHIADLERNLSYDGRYEEFKQKFEEANGEPWTEARNEFDYSQDDVVDVLADMGVMTEEAARNLCEKAFTPYPKSIEDFARMVKKYAERKGRNHHIVFLVDEIGQYIGTDPGLMLNLQTVTEDLGTACQGKAWIIVTSQQDIDSVIKVKGNDFSKIMGRFDTRLSLSSANVDEVIKKRILEKTSVAAQTLSVLYYIALNTSKHTKTSMKTIMDRFTKAPYGFIEDDVEWLIAKLFKDGDIALFVNSEAVSLFNKQVEEIVKYITRKEYVEKLMTEKREKPGEKQVKTARDVMKKLFNVTSTAENEDDLMKSFMTYAKTLKNDLERLEIHYQSQPKYPGRQVITNGKKLLNNVLALDYSNAFYNKVYDDRDDYFDFADDYEPLKTFFAGDQKKIFDKSLNYMVIFDDSKTFITNQEIFSIAKEIKEILKMESPYGQIYKLPGLNEKYASKYMEILEAMAQPVYAAIADAKKRVLKEIEGKQCEYVMKPRVEDQFAELQKKAEECNNVARLQNIKVEADALKIRLLNSIPADPILTSPEIKDDDHHEPPKIYKKSKTISIKSINTSTTWQLESAEDVDKYLRELREKLINTLEENTVTHIEF